ncbi:MFS transporter [Ilumatobacter sp.]|uniref:MFS transporter n=1 Tax=Ilumatobacter sp. TaxID=1967498 RepID=UPI003B527F49
MEPGGRILARRWPADPERIAALDAPRDDLLDEVEVHRSRHGERTTVVFEQRHGPFLEYRRELSYPTERLGPIPGEAPDGRTGGRPVADVRDDGDGIEELTRFRLRIPWFGWLFAIPVRQVLARRLSASGWWAPPDHLDAIQLLVIGLLAAASMSAAFVNTLFTQTVGFAADDFGVGETVKGDAGSIVRAGIVFALPAAVVADRIGRRRVLIVVAWLAPLLSVVGAAAPNFASLVATQTVARPMGIALAFVVGVVAAEEVPRNSRAYAVSVLAMAAGLGAGIAVMSLALADVGPGGWRLVYLVSVVWCVVALDLTRRLPETRRFAAEAARQLAAPSRARLDRRRFALLAAVAFAGNVFIAPASFFQNTYLQDVRGFDGTKIGIFSILIGTPSGIGLILGGRFADRRGRRTLISVALPLSVIAVVAAFTYGEPWLWVFSLAGGILGAAVYPAMTVYRTELFPTGNRTRASGFVTASALVGGIGGLSLTGRMIDGGWSYSSTLAVLAIGQLVVTVLVVAFYPETAHRELEQLNPQDAPVDLEHVAPDPGAAPPLDDPTLPRHG